MPHEVYASLVAITTKKANTARGCERGELRVDWYVDCERSLRIGPVGTERVGSKADQPERLSGVLPNSRVAVNRRTEDALKRISAPVLRTNLGMPR